jgi:hypothetical protein
MDTLNFLRRVLPSKGIYVVTVINGDKPKQGFFTDLDKLADSITKLSQSGNNVYYAVSAFKEKGSRKQENVQATKLLALDIDVGKENNSYATARDALTGIQKFISTSGMPKPMLVQSGNGFHMYWVLDEELAPEQWTPLARAFKEMCAKSELVIDPAVPADSARVLRPVGTLHPNGKEVKLVMDAPSYPVAQIEAVIRKHVAVSKTLPAAPGRHDTGLLAALAVPNDMPVAVAAVVEKKCLQIVQAMDKPEQIPEPLWYLILGTAAYTDEPEEAAHRWSQGHTGYDASTTVKKMQQWKIKTTGPSTCAKFKELNPSGCKNCQYKDKIVTPAQLGKQYQEVTAVEDPPDEIASVIDIPKPFKRTADGIKMTLDDTDIDVCSFDIYPVGYGKDFSLGYETVRYHWKRQHVGWQELSFRQAYLADGSREFPAAVADQGIVLNSRRQTEYFQLMLRSYMEKLRHQRAVTNLYANMGWKENFTQFVLGDTIYRRNTDSTVSEEVVTLSSGVQRLGGELFTTAGSTQEWSKLIGILAKAKAYPQLVALAIGASAPLYALSSLKGVTVSLCGPTGSGKTLTQIMIQSIYGNPEKLHFAARFTSNVVYTRMGFYSHLPFTIDEASVIGPKEIGDLVYCVPQGRDKARLNRNADEREAKEWALPNIISTNKPVQEMLFNSSMVGDAQMARLIELPMNPLELFSKDSDAGRMLYLAMLDNHGLVGREIIKNLLQIGEQQITELIASHHKRFAKRYRCQFSGHERFWEQALVLGDLMMLLMRKWGLIDFNHTEAFQWVINVLSGVREEIENNRLDSFDMVSNFLNDHASSILTIMHTTGKQSTAMQDYDHSPRSDIRARFDVYRKATTEPFTSGTLMLDRSKFRLWMSENGYDYTSFVREMRIENIEATPKSGKYSLGKNTSLRLGQTYVVGVNLNHPRLVGMLSNIDEQLTNLTFGDLQVVKETAGSVG